MVIHDTSPVGRMKAVKNATEVAGMERAHVRDSVALVRFFHWLDGQAARMHADPRSPARSSEQGNRSERGEVGST